MLWTVDVLVMLAPVAWATLEGEPVFAVQVGPILGLVFAIAATVVWSLGYRELMAEPEPVQQMAPVAAPVYAPEVPVAAPVYTPEPPQATPQRRFCTACGAERTSNGLFCTKCGTKFNN